ncbi:MAG TPA: DUF362 domain-containing protein [Acidobacteriaceae bacterium]|jgi:uncharacterized protein (DUF362 family)|nr:DUF362 domain-containing protein [Acidobacteriaceae bacterium]
MSLSRRGFVQLAGAGLLAQTPFLRAGVAEAKSGNGGAPAEPLVGSGGAKVALIRGEDRRKNAHDALAAIDDQIRPLLARRRKVLIKPNNVSTTNQLAATHRDALEGILDYLEPRFRGPVTIAEASAGDTLEGFEHFHYDEVARERRAQRVELVDLNREGTYQTVAVLDADLHVAEVRLAARVLDPDTFVISSAMLKTHNTVVATMSVKNVVLGSPLHSPPGQLFWSDKRKFHVGIRQTHYNMLVTAERLRPQWGVALIDGFEGMEGDGPGNGTAVSSHVAIASTDFVAADRVGLEVMGINSEWVGYLGYCGQAGVGTFDLAKISVVGAKIADVARKYQLHPDMQRELEWMGPRKLGSPTVGTLEERHISSVYG